MILLELTLSSKISA